MTTGTRSNHPHVRKLDQMRHERSLISRIDLSAPRRWITYGRRHSEVACQFAVDGERFWVLFNNKGRVGTMHGPRTELPSHNLKPAQPRYVALAEAQLQGFIDHAKRLLGDME